MVKEHVQKATATAYHGNTGRTNNCLVCSQPKSRYCGDGSSIHLFQQSGEVKYKYSFTKVHQTWQMRATQTLRCHLLSAETPFFNRELEATQLLSAESRRMIEEWRKKKDYQSSIPLVVCAGSATDHSNRVQAVHRHIDTSWVPLCSREVCLLSC